MQESLEEKDYLFQMLLDNVPVVIFKTNKDGVFTRSVGLGLKVFGVKDNESVGKSIFELYPVAGEIMRRALAGESFKFVADVEIKGKMIFLDVTLCPDPSDVGGVIGLLLDITRQNNVEEKPRKASQVLSPKNKKLMGINEETTSLNDAVEKAKQQFLSNMSHEIRTPMNAVIGITNLLLQENPKPEQIESLKILKLSGENLLELINDVLDYSKLESGKMLVEPIDFNLIDLVNNVKETHHLTAKEKGLEFKIKIDSDLPVMVVGDPTRLAQILNNLVSNAIKFTNKGSVIMDLSLNRMVGNLVDIDFVVTDTGIGIETDKRDYIFESFTQGSANTTKAFGGTGLGLAITKKIVALLGGNISVKSVVGIGSTFLFNLQFKKSKKKVGHTAVPEIVADFSSLAGFRILLVEDNEINVIVARKFMQKWGLHIDCAANGTEAVEKVIENHYDLVLMDLEMPKMDGYEATKVIRSIADDKFKQLPIIALTASLLTEINKQILEAGIDDYVAKPFSPLELHSKIRQYLHIN